MTYVPGRGVFQTNELPFEADYAIRSGLTAVSTQTIIYKTGGASGTVLKTVTITYTADNEWVEYSQQ